MIEINLLPVREARRKADIRQQLMQLVLVLILSAAAIGYADSRISSQITNSQRRIVQMEADIKQFQPQLDQVAAFRKKKANLEKKIDVISELDRARRGPVRVLDEFASHVPERVWLTGLKSEGNAITVSGASLDNELVAGLLQAMNDSPYFDKVDLDSTVLGEKDGLKVVTFSVQASLVAPKPVKAKADPAAGATKASAKGAPAKQATQQQDQG